AWEFDYQLRPRNEAVRQVPEMPFWYHKKGEPNLQPTYGEPIHLTVLPREQVEAGDLSGTARPVQRPEAYRVVTGDAVVRSEEAFELPGPFVLAALVLLPPALCMAWFLVWKRRNPDAVHLARQHQSRLGRQTLQALRSAGKEATGERVTALVADYLRKRF